MRTTLDLPDTLFKEVKTRAVQEGVTLKALVTEFIQVGLSRHREIPRQRPPLPVAFRKVEGSPAIPYRTNAELFAILEREDISGISEQATSES